LTDEAAPRRAESGANGELARAAGAAHELEMRDVRAGDEQDETRRGEQHEQRGLHVAGNHVVKRRNRRTDVGSTLLLVERRRERRHFRAGPGQRHVRLEPREDPQRSALVARSRVENQRHPQLRFRRPERREPETFRHDADDGVSLPVERDGGPHYIRIGREPGFPERMPQNDDTVAAEVLFVRAEHASDQRLDAQKRQDVGRQVQRVQLIGPLGAGEIGCPEFGRANPFERAGPRAPFEKRLGRYGRTAVADDDEAAGIRVGERSQQDRVHDAEDCGVGANAECARDECRGGEPGRSAQEAQRKAKIHHRFDVRAMVEVRSGPEPLTLSAPRARAPA